MEKIKYLGQIIDKDSRRPDPERASEIKKKHGGAWKRVFTSSKFSCSSKLLQAQFASSS